MPAGRLLIVDDEKAFAEFIRVVATNAGYEAQVVGLASDFEFHLAHWQPTVVFLDIIMPDRDGLELIGALERQKFGGHLVLMSGSDARYINMTGASARARGLQLAAVLSKPCRKKQIDDLLNKLAGDGA
jgi:DNA-binding response OmpR family regulator